MGGVEPRLGRVLGAAGVPLTLTASDSRPLLVLASTGADIRTI
jgi:hypothetical protein